MIIQKAVKLAMNVFEQKMTEFANKTEGVLNRDSYWFTM